MYCIELSGGWKILRVCVCVCVSYRVIVWEALVVTLTLPRFKWIGVVTFF